MVVKNSIDFTVFSRKQFEIFRQLIPDKIECGGHQFIHRHTYENPTIQYDPEAKCEIIEEPDSKSLVVEVSDISAIVVPCDDSIKLGLKWTTKRCLGYTSQGRDVGIVVALPSVTHLRQEKLL